MATEEPCTACRWTPEQQRCCSYKSHIRLFRGAGTRGAWSLGSQYIIKDRENDPPCYDPQNTRFVQEHTTIPVPLTILEWDEPDKSCLRVVKRIDGITLGEAWPHLSETEKHDIAKQTCSYLKQLRSLHSSKIESIDHGPLYDLWLFFERIYTPHGPLESDDELWNEMARGGELNKLPRALLEVLGKNMPPATPYTFTHGDLTFDNIIVKDGKVAGIIDWERSGYKPVWWEFVNTLIPDGEEDLEWKCLLREYMKHQGDGHERALNFWKDCHGLRGYPDLSEYGRQILAKYGK